MRFPRPVRFRRPGAALRPAVLVAAAGVAALALTACGGPSDETTPTGSPTPSGASMPPEDAGPESTAAATTPPPETADCPQTARVTLAVPGPSGPRFAGYYAALDRGYYSGACLDVAIITSDASPEALAELGAGTADVAVAPLAEGLRARESGSALVNVAQVFQRSGTIQVSLASAGIEGPSDFRGQRVGLGRSGGWEVLAATSKAGLDPVADTTLVTGGGIEALLAGDVDAAAALTYDGYQRLLGQPSPTTGAPLSPEDLRVVDYQADGVALLPDGLWARSDRVDDAAGADALQRFITASLRGWIDCREDPGGCAALPGIAPSGDVQLASRMVEAVNALIWPSPLGVGVIDPAARDRTVQVALVTKDLDGGRLITRAPDEGAIVTGFASEADAQLSSQGLNVTG